jgi:hypothetical protein
MLEVLRLVAWQLGAVAALMVLLHLGLRLVLPNNEQAITIPIFVQVGVVLVAAVWGIFVKPWWVYAACWAVGLLLFTVLSMLLLSLLEPVQMQKIGPAGTAFILPWIVAFFALPISGVLNWLLRLVRQ